MSLRDKVALVTGGGSGIGKAIAKALLAEGCKVIINGRNEEKLNQAKSELGANVESIVCDVTDEGQVENTFNGIISNYGSFDILINNAGILLNEYQLLALETTEDSILKTFNTNTLGVLRVCKSIVPLMVNGGRIINISSGMGQLDEMESGSTAYRISKTSLNALTKILSNELSGMRIKVNTICPGWVQTDMGGENATLTIEESTIQIAAFALRDNFPNGQFLRHGELIPW